MINNPRVLILSSQNDEHANIVGDYLRKRNIETVQWMSNVKKPTTQPHIEFGENGSKYIFIDKNQRFSIQDFTSIWVRKPDWFNYPKRIYKPSEGLTIDYWRKETHALCTAILLEAANHSVFVVNDSLINPFATNKQNQLTTAKSLGATIPYSLVTYSLKEAEAFIALNNDECIIKSLGIGTVMFGNHGKYFTTRLINSKELRKSASNGCFYYPVFLQNKVKKAYELRITIVGSKIFTCKIDSQSVKDARLDWRHVDFEKVPITQCKLPKKIEKFCFDLCRALKLQYGAIDMAVTPKGEFVFFEINPNGQYYWVEYMTGMKISEAVADLLADPHTSKL